MAANKCTSFSDEFRERHRSGACKRTRYHAAAALWRSEFPEGKSHGPRLVPALKSLGTWVVRRDPWGKLLMIASLRDADYSSPAHDAMRAIKVIARMANMSPSFQTLPAPTSAW